MLINFKDHPEFTPNLSPRQIFEYGSFGGGYFRDIESPSYSGTAALTSLPPDLWQGIDKDLILLSTPDKANNKYGVNAGTSLEAWRNKGWIKESIDPYGWVQWYCHFYYGRRVLDDARQIKRWLSFAGPNGRFRKRLISEINKKNGKFDDYSISPVIRQSLQHWAYELTEEDFNGSK
tara:strand:+ start:40 stop:570 length:531 start_codon:yes stop_codon:yes gene_type:complete